MFQCLTLKLLNPDFKFKSQFSFHTLWIKSTIHCTNTKILVRINYKIPKIPLFE